MTTTLIILFLFAVIGFNIWNAINLNRIVKKPMRRDELNDSKYWELNHKMQYLVTIFTVILAIVTYLGYNTIEDIKKSISSELQNQMDSTKARIVSLDSSIKTTQDSAQSKLHQTDSVLNNYQNQLLGISDRSKAVNNSISVSNDQLDNLKDRIKIINEKNIIKQEIYIVSDISVTYKEDADFPKKTFYFKDLKTITGDGLPDFGKPPFILVFSNQGHIFQVTNVSTSSFTLGLSMYQAPSDNPKIFEAKATVFITTNP